jgi:hypothetical protein
MSETVQTDQVAFRDNMLKSGYGVPLDTINYTVNDPGTKAALGMLGLLTVASAIVLEAPVIIMVAGTALLGVKGVMLVGRYLTEKSVDERVSNDLSILGEGATEFSDSAEAISDLPSGVAKGILSGPSIIGDLIDWGRGVLPESLQLQK